MNGTTQVLCWITCDGVHIDPSSGKHYILGVFSNIRVREFPAIHPVMVWFLTLTDVPTGKHQLTISLGELTDMPQTIVDREFESKSPAMRLNLINQIQNLRFTKPGDYSVTIDIDGETLLVTSFGVYQAGGHPAS